MKRKQELQPRLNVRLRRSFGSCCLPRTMSLARKIRRQLRSMLKAFPASWQWEDRVLVLLLPSLLEDVEHYYTKQGPCMREIFEQHQIEHFDEDLANLLEAHMRTEARSGGKGN